jgi:hypothetical protein
MDEVTSFKLQVAERRRELDRVIALFEAFKQYIDRFAEWIRGDLGDEGFRAAQERFSLRIEADSHRFTEWHDGEQVLHYEIFTLVREPEACRNPDVFKDHVLRATLKFQHLLQEAREQLAAERENLAIVAGEEAAAAVAAKPEESSTIEKVKVAEEVLDKSFTWGERVVTIGPWLVKLLELL